jgi:MoxR-like ATPase
VFVLATENPIEQEGTHPLPEAQLDRFLFNVVIDYPTSDEERRILAETTTGRAADVQPVATSGQLENARSRELPVAANVVDYRRPDARDAAWRSICARRDPRLIGRCRRAGQALILGAKAAR